MVELGHGKRVILESSLRDSWICANLLGLAGRLPTRGMTNISLVLHWGSTPCPHLSLPLLRNNMEQHEKLIKEVLGLDDNGFFQFCWLVFHNPRCIQAEILLVRKAIQASMQNA